MTNYIASRELNSDVSLTDALDFFRTKIFQSINTITLGKILDVNLITKRLQIQPLINSVDTNNAPIISPVIYDVPYGTIRGGNAGIITEYQINDTVIVGFCGRQIDATKATMGASTPTLYRYFNLQDAVVLSHWSNTDPTIFLKIANDGITIQGSTLPISVTTTNNVTINAQNATINATTITLAGDTKIDGVNFLQHKHIDVQTGGGISGIVLV
jgi:hypothetical protein